MHGEKPKEKEKEKEREKGKKTRGEWDFFRISFKKILIVSEKMRNLKSFC